MAGKSDFVDYEPLRRPRRVSDIENEDFPVPEEPASSGEFERKFYQAREKSPIPPSHPHSDIKQILKRGHALSFIGLYLFTFFVFFRPYELSSFAWLSRSALVTAIITLLVFIPTQLGLENRITIRPRELNLVFLLVAFALLSVPFALSKVRAWDSFVEYMKVVIMFVVMINVVRTEKRLKALILLIMVVSIILSVTAIKDYRAGNLVLGERIAGAIGNLFDNPNDLALHLVMYLPIFVGLALGSRYLAGKLIYFAAAASLLGGTIVTFSRGGFLGLCTVVAVLVWKLGKRNRFIILILTAVLIASFLIFVPKAYRQRIATTGDESAQSRKGELTRSIFLALRHPIFGVGMDNYILYSNTEHATHNAYTQVAADLGLPAAAVYILFLITALKQMRRIPNPQDVEKRKRSLPYLAIGLQASLIGYMVTSFFASVAYLWYIYYLVGYAICVSRLYESSVEIQPQTGPAGSS